MAEEWLTETFGEEKKDDLKKQALQSVYDHQKTLNRDEFDCWVALIENARLTNNVIGHMIYLAIFPDLKLTLSIAL